VRTLDLSHLPDDGIDPAGLLSPEELRRMEAFRHPAGRQAFVAARALLRTLLSELHADVPGCPPPGGWRFALGPHGKPELAPGQLAREVGFNLSHCRGLVAVAVAADAVVGIDVEALDRRVSDDLAVARRHFAAAEFAAIEAIADPGQRRMAFLDLWTAKEAFIKACGQGLAMPLASFHVDLPGSRYAPDSLPLAARDRIWTLARWHLPDHYLALAVGATPTSGELRIDCRAAVWEPESAMFRGLPDPIPAMLTVHA
jgi:4'-phosphopantetheinyl transferase